MSLEVTGKIIQIMDVVTGSSPRGDWKKQEFVIETLEQYPKKICLSVWGDKVDSLKSYPVGSILTAGINIESREYNQRWYTDIRAWRLQSPSSAQPGAEAHPQDFSQENNAQENNNQEYQASESDDLPF